MGTNISILLSYRNKYRTQGKPQWVHAPLVLAQLRELGENLAIARSHALPDLAAPEHDLGALENEVRAAQARLVAHTVDRWRQHFQDAGVTTADINTLAETIDRPFLLQQRQAIAEPKPSATPHQKG